jgi:predicted glycosyltransferase
MAREAACMGVPAFSFYTGKELLTVDKKMIDQEWIYFSRNHSDLIEKFKTSLKRAPNLERPKEVKKQILAKLDDFIGA